MGGSGEGLGSGSTLFILRDIWWKGRKDLPLLQKKHGLTFPRAKKTRCRVPSMRGASNRLEVVCRAEPSLVHISSDQERHLEMLGSWAGPTGGRAFVGPGGCPVPALLAPPRFEPQARLSARALPPARSCSRFGCSGFPRRGGGAGSARSDSRLGFLHQCRAAPGGLQRPSLLPGTTFHSYGARGGASVLCDSTRAPSPPLPSPALLLGNHPPQPAAPQRWRPLP